MPQFIIEPSTIPGQWMVLKNGVPMRNGQRLVLFSSAMAASNYIAAMSR